MKCLIACQFGREIYLRAGERDGNGTGLFRFLGLFLEILFIDPWSVDFGVQVDGRDLRTAVDHFEFYRRGRADAFGGMAGLLEIR